MLVRRFLVTFKNMPIDRSSVKSGKNGPEVVTACRCVNVGLFVSGDLRRDVVVSLAIGNAEEVTVISFPGNSLKRVSPDERSISFFLLKALEKTHEMDIGMTLTMDNGIELEKGPLDKLAESWDSHVLQAPSDHPERFILDSNLAADREQNPP